MPGLMFRALLAAALGVVSTAGAERLELTDGTVVFGAIESMAHGRYVVATEGLGRIEIDADRIVRITRDEDPARAPGAARSTVAGVQAFQEQLLGSPDLMRAIAELQSDPAVMAVLADREFMGLIARGDLAALQENPQMRKLLEHPSIRAIVEQVAR